MTCPERRRGQRMGTSVKSNGGQTDEQTCERLPSENEKVDKLEEVPTGTLVRLVGTFQPQPRCSEEERGPRTRKKKT
eukprot:scaffold317_cov260-Pinguiococcus_pyrenoidosus.AAC.26